MSVSAGSFMASNATHVVRAIEHRLRQEVIWKSEDSERLVYHYGTDYPKPFLHPLRAVNGEVLTDFQPSDHPWHRGVWFAWKFINGINFWEERAHAGEDAGAGFGCTEFAGADELISRPEVTRITTNYNYRSPEGTVLLREQRTLTVSFPLDRSCAIDWEATFYAGEQPVRLDRTAVAAETLWGGYAGLSFRATSTWRDVQGLDSEGRRNMGINHQRARWVHMTGLGSDGQRTGLAILDHPENPRYPSYWYYSDETRPLLGFAYMNPSLLLSSPYDLSAGEGLRLRYRILVLDGSFNATALEDQHSAFARGSRHN